MRLLPTHSPIRFSFLTLSRHPDGADPTLQVDLAFYIDGHEILDFSVTSSAIVSLGHTTSESSIHGHGHGCGHCDSPRNETEGDQWLIGTMTAVFVFCFVQLRLRHDYDCKYYILRLYTSSLYVKSPTRKIVSVEFLRALAFPSSPQP